MSRFHCALAFFEGLSLQDVPHRAGNLKEHLVRTCKRLQGWGYPEEVCLAGLFHSVLGTQHFGRRTVGLRELPALEEAIGSRACLLVQLFSVSRRPETLVNALLTGELELLHGERRMSLEPGQACDLVSIEYANLLDQGTEHCLVNALRSRSEQLSSLKLSAAVRRSWGRHTCAGKGSERGYSAA